MEEARLNITFKRPTLVLDHRFPITNDLEFGKKVQLEAEVQVEGMAIEPDMDGNDINTYTFYVNKAELITKAII